MADMYRPALIIGLGGTGVLTLRHLKSLLLSSQEARNGGTRKLPPQVRLIALDTVKDSRHSAQTEGNIKIAALRTELEAGEYYWIGGDVYSFVREIAEGKHPHISSWFQADTYLRVLPQASFTLEQGAGQLRQFGRLAIFYDVHAPHESAIYSLMRKSIQDIRDAVGHLTSLDVFLVASVAGGTGAGMFVDIAYLIRRIAKQEFNTPVRLRGFMVLPEAFSAIPGGVKSDMRARAFACMRENKRFMVDFDYEYGYPMYYHAQEGNEIWHGRIKSKLFDTLYHVDGRSHRNPLNNLLPEYGVTAGIADAITAMLDAGRDQAQNPYDQHIANVITQASNLGISIGDERRVSFDSAVGCYSLILPMHHIVEWLSYRLARESLERLFPVQSWDEDGYALHLAEDSNAEEPGVRGRTAAESFLDRAEIISLASGEKVSGTPFWREVLRVAREYRGDEQAIVGELSNRGAKEWEEFLDPAISIPDVQRIRERVQEELGRRLLDEVPPNVKGEKAAAAVERIKQGVEQYKGYHLGRLDRRTGQRVGGQYRAALQEYAKVHAERFRLMLETEMLNILNGGQDPSEPPSIHRGGKLGYFLDWLGGIEGILGGFLAAINDARTEREERGEKADLEETAQAKLRELEAKPGGIFGGRRRQSYLEAEQALIDFEKGLIAEDVARGLVQEILGHVHQLKESGEAWAATLMIGFNSMYGHILRAQKQVEDAIEKEGTVPTRKYLWDKEYMEELYHKYARDMRSGVDEVLKRFEWKQEYRRRGGQEIYQIRPLVRVSQDPSRDWLGEGNMERNLQLFLTPVREIFEEVWQQESILKYLMERAYRDPLKLANELAEKVDVWLEAMATQVVPANYLHVAHGTDPAERNYIKALKERLAAVRQGQGAINEVINSSDRFSLRLVYTKDLIPLHEIDSYKRAEDAYWTESVTISTNTGIRGRLGREVLHIFPAEVNAARLESKIPKVLGIPARALHNEVVFQLEDMARFRLFVRSWAFEVIRRGIQEGEQGGYENYWKIDLPEQPLGFVIEALPAVEIYLTKPVAGQEPDLLDAMMIWNYERRDVRESVYIEIDYDRVRDAVKKARNAQIEKMREEGRGVDERKIADLVQRLPEEEKKQFEDMWLERMFLKQRQSELRKDIFSKGKTIKEQDAAIAMYLVLEEDINSLSMKMEDILRRFTR